MSVQEISSAQNPKYRRWLSLIESRGIKKEGLALVSGEKILKELLAQQPELIEEWLLPPKADEQNGPSPATRLTSPLFHELDVIGTKKPIAVVRVKALPTWKAEAPKGIELILALSDPSNLGSCLRSAEAFGVSKVILTQESASPFLPKAIRSASGSTFRLSIETTGSIKDVSAPGEVIGLDMNGTPLGEFKWPDNMFLVLGEEGQGLPQTLKTKTISIPMQAPVESLNATIAAALALYSRRLFMSELF